MDALAVQRVCVWLDGLAPGQGAFAHALDWAARLGLPLCGLAHSPGTRGGRTAYPRSEGGPGEGRPVSASAEQRQACERVCQSRGVAWTASPREGPVGGRGGHAACPAELCAWGAFLPGRLKEALLRKSWEDTQTAALVCPRSWRPVSRVLVLNQPFEPGSGFLESAVALCRTLQVVPIVLTVDRSEEAARLRQRTAEEVFAVRGWRAEFDFIVGCDVCTAVTWATRWRRCTHVFVERRPVPPWSRWLHGDTLRRLLALPTDLTFLALPGAGQPLPRPADLHPSAAGREAGQAP